MAVRGTADGERKWEVSHRYLTGQIERATQRTVIMRNVNDRVKVGIEVNALVDEIGFVGNFRALSETDRRPALILGTSSDRIGTPSGQSYFATVSKSLQRETGLPIAPYVGASYSEFESRIIYPFGLNIGIGERTTVLLMNDGVHPHASLTRGFNRFSLTLLAVRLKDFGFTIGTSF